MQCSACLHQAFREHILFSMSEMFEGSMATGLSTGRTLSPVWALRRTNGANFTSRSPFADLILHSWRHRPLLCLRKTRRCGDNEAEKYYRFSLSALRVLNCLVLRAREGECSFYSGVIVFLIPGYVNQYGCVPCRDPKVFLAKPVKFHEVPDDVERPGLQQGTIKAKSAEQRAINLTGQSDPAILKSPARIRFSCLD
jgi:hypothetical protein